MNRWLGLRMVIGLCSTLLGGCLFDPVPIELKAELPSNFSQPGQTPLPDKWWEAFDDHDLNALIDVALGNNPGIDCVKPKPF